MEFRENSKKALSITRILTPRHTDKFSFQYIKPARVYDVIQNLKKSDSSGPNAVTSRFISETPHFLSLAMCHLCNQMVRTYIFPPFLKTW